MRKSSTSECDDNAIHDIDFGIAVQKNDEAQGPSASISRKLSSLRVHCGLPSISASNGNGSKVEGVWKGRFFVTRCDDV